MLSFRKITANCAGGLICILIGLFLFWWTYYKTIPTISALIPRLSFLAIILGGLMVVGKDITRDLEIKMDGTLQEALTAIPIMVSMFLYGHMILILGIGVTTFLYLSGFWILFRYRMKHGAPKWANPFNLTSLSAIIGISFYILFVKMLEAYIPDTWLL